MIVGIGSDLIDIRRIEKALIRHGDRFVERLFTGVERARSQAKPAPAASFAKRFAAKEACAKALGTGMRRGVYWRDMGVVNQRSGQPGLVLTGGAAARLREMTPSGFRAHIHLSLTDEFPLAQAFVIISVERDGFDPNAAAGAAHELASE